MLKWIMFRPTIVIASRNNGWILDHIALDLKKQFSGTILRLPSSRRQFLLQLKAYFYLKNRNLIFMHQNLFINAINQYPKVLHAKSVVFFTHQNSYTEESLVKLGDLKFANKVIVLSNQIKSFLISIIGENDSNHIVVRVGGANLSTFFNQNMQRRPGSVVLVVYFALRKRPDLIVRTVRTNPNYNFILHGKNWENSDFLKDLQVLPNFQYFEFEFASANNLFNSSEVFLSLSDIEGGPVPALEALAAGCRVILTNTGFSKELSEISDSVQVIPINPSSSVVTQALDKARELPPPSGDVSVNFSYEEFLQEFLIK
jgi:glycosyltransferase involved in cell wall biosynthesis